MACYHYRIVNVFAESTFGGNPLCVFEDARGMSDATMQALALQFNLSETTFLLPSDTADAMVRIFTPGFEMRFAGHPTLGSAHVMRSLMETGDALKLEFKAGVVPVTALGDVWTFTAPAPVDPPMRAAGITRDLIARMIGLMEDDLQGDPMWVDTGTEQLLIRVKDMETVRRTSPAGALFAQWPLSGQDRKMAYVFAFGAGGGERTEVAARFFYAKHGDSFSEDPGTGSACANLGGWLIGTGHALPCSFQINQGEAVGRPCRLLLDVTAQRAIQVSGRVIALGRGSVDI